MTREQAIFNFWNSFNIPAFEETSVPTGENAPTYPYITYRLVIDNFGSQVQTSASVYDRDKDNYSALFQVLQKTAEIRRKISRGGIMLAFDSGVVWLKPNTPFSQIMGDSEDNAVRRAYLNMTAEFISAD